MKVIMVYLGMGVCLMFLIECIIHAYENQLEFMGENAPKFSMGERIFGILLWPFIVLVYIKSFLK
tara:strand:+ start:47 stop:241 length:195 start_codon:yes stop_codon:yes gene_type:complete